jgi:hypothetical protein
MIKSKNYKPEISQENKTKYKNLLKDLIKDAKNGIFNKKEFKYLHADKSYLKTPIYHFFDSKTEFEHWPERPIKFTCIVCHTNLHEKIGDSTNLTSHLKLHNKTTDKSLTEWINLYKNSKPVNKNKKGNQFNFLYFKVN